MAAAIKSCVRSGSLQKCLNLTFRRACSILGTGNVIYGEEVDKKVRVKGTLTDVEVSTDPEEWKYVERLLPKNTIPDPPDHRTPSGWVPPAENIAGKYPYCIRRTKNHMYPVYYQEDKDKRHLTKIRYITGDVWSREIAIINMAAAIKSCVRSGSLQKCLNLTFRRACSILGTGNVIYGEEVDKKVRVKGTLTDVEVSTDPEEWKYVERLLPKDTIPDPPDHRTPSGWVPPAENIAGKYPYCISRTKNHMYPVYYQEDKDKRHLTKIRYITGDVWAFEADLRAHLEKMNPGKIILTRVFETAGIVHVKGIYLEHVTKFLLDRGF
ncbi:probable 39S ribosomal protein L49, mitochondrial [Lingula anatina]|uniref:Large ribosomal subunit protein mL49 n=1 Tax=Lingula anatina TaxID=7574 RepID=A0A1S3JJT3_LINAN|nr:probable 39S ribosomal protein L49, mitochondrial [Lingula anatina]|eukprot:XP_013410396.1 probable 39S ribosomal protein L49, mitochondrial [Lingula anatina]